MTARAVVDASVCLGWFFSDEAEPGVLALEERACASPSLQLLVPPAFWSEVANVLSIATRRERMDSATALECLDRLNAYGLDEFHVDWATCLALSIDTGIAAYDVQYLLVAKTYDAVLWTTDRALARAAVAHGVTTEP